MEVRGAFPPVPPAPGTAVRSTGDSATVRYVCRVARLAGWALLGFSFFLVLISLFASSAHAQISPGPLSRQHRNLDGPSGCTRCHAVSAGSPEFRCLDCHTEIATRLRQRRGLHPSLMDPNGGNGACVRCHSEHNGENFALVKWNPSPGAFEHNKTGFVLDGKHANLDCRKCHTPLKVPLVDRQALISKDLARTYLGLSRDCITCHEDKHRGQLGNNCLQCHNTADWKVARIFDHGKTKYPLRGAHLQVSCQKCHQQQTDGTMKYVGLKFDRCSSCHSDPHRAAFPQQCESCHTVASWRQTSVASRFDHSRTRYPLVGKHLEVGCLKCHRAANFKAAVKHDLCADCHKPDPHEGQFAKRADGGRCETCHDVQGFKPAKFKLAEHNISAFPLRGKHATVDCAKCHVSAGRRTLYRVKFAMCLDCHKDVHVGQFAPMPFTNHCEQCHNENTFQPSTFTLARHQKSSFVLTGGHVAVACADCHKPMSNSKAAVFHFEGLVCTSCHSDPHRNQFAVRMAKLTASRSPAGCEICHSTSTWKDLSRFDHANTRFALVGTHRAVECIACHRPPNLERKLLNVDFKAAPSDCDGCHDDPHGAQFAHLSLATRCANCHNSNKWRPSLFDHETTAFSLKGAHANVRCAACHTFSSEVNGKQVLFYKPAPTKCAACHGNRIATSGSVPGF